MRRAALVVVLLLSCSKGDDKGKPGGEPAPGAAPSGAQPGKREYSVKGTITFGGAMNASMSWKPDLNLTCACIKEDQWGFDATLTDGAGGFSALEVTIDKQIILTSGKLPTPEPLRNTGGAGVSGSCKLDNRNANGVMAVDLDAKLNGKAGDVTVKGHLDIVCRDGL